ncbi:Transcription factor bHLH54 [Zea mays]|uniref:Transcription factor bHLH54 n=1 Tax=Zea mays TaxID=4577 RepID=A0A1D6JRW2_MAIZE|nr:Transcription factor bHLH54 [Zea mays]
MESSEASWHWHSFDPSVAVEDSEAMVQLLGVQYSGNEQKQTTPTAMSWPGQEADQYYSSTACPYYMQTQQPNPGASFYDHGYYGSNTFTMTGDFFVPEEQMLDLNLDFEYQGGEGTCYGRGGGNTPAVCKRKLENQKDESATCTVPKKKSRSAAVPQAQKKRKTAQKGACSRGNQEESYGDDGGNAKQQQQCSNDYLSDDDDSLEMIACGNVSSASKKSSSSACGKARAGRGATTDPQSLYARVDISTMLEEAVQYVKFLQLQIKLLSSDDMWMFAPIAYNGVNVGLDLKISPPQQ